MMISIFIDWLFQCNAPGLPSVANQEGCALLVPKTTKEDHESNSNVDTLLSILQTLGGYVECETEEQMVCVL